jgi:hypothetical protein
MALKCLLSLTLSLDRLKPFTQRTQDLPCLSTTTLEFLAIRLKLGPSYLCSYTYTKLRSAAVKAAVVGSTETRLGSKLKFIEALASERVTSNIGEYCGRRISCIYLDFAPVCL